MLATNNGALAEYAYNAGQDDPGSAWILTPWDVWKANPHYSGPPVRHPEDDGFDDENADHGEDEYDEHYDDEE